MKRIGFAALAALAVLAGGCHRGRDLTRDMTGKPVALAGSYALTCRNVASAADGTLTAECMDAHSQFHAASLAAGACHSDIANINGALACSH